MRVTIEGAGCVSAAGPNRKAAWSTYRSEQANYLTGPLSLPVFAVADDQLPDHLLEYQRQHHLDRTSLLALCAAEEAITEADWQGTEFAILVGCSRGPTTAWERAHATHTRGDRLPLRTSPNTTLGSTAFALAHYFQTGMLASSMSVTCSSGLHALVHGVALLRSGMVKRVLVGGTEAPLTDFTLAQLHQLGIYTQGRSGYVCRPLATPTTGMAIGEGAAFIALSLADRPCHPVITGLGFSQERSPTPTGLTKNGLALQQSMRVASSGFLPSQILAHAPGTRKGDAAERRAVNAVFADGPPPAMTSLKWATGHTFGASGTLALVAAIDMLQHGHVPPLPYAELQPVPTTPPSSILINATGFGGNATTLRLQTTEPATPPA